jgi:hypothetical protein
MIDRFSGVFIRIKSLSIPLMNTPRARTYTYKFYTKIPPHRATPCVTPLVWQRVEQGVVVVLTIVR